MVLRLDLKNISVFALLISGSFAPIANAEQQGSVGSKSVASVTYGPYARLEYGSAEVSTSGGYWHPPGYPSDPQINFDLEAGKTGFGSVAFGYDWMNGFRGDLSLTVTGTTDVSGPCSSASDNTPCSDHADISDGSVSTTAMMGNVFYSPLEQRGGHSVFQPFLVAGIGIANNKVGEWTRERTSHPTEPIRSFEGSTNSALAWSVGIGAAWQITGPGDWPIILEAAWRYYDFGTAKGSSEPVTSGRPPVDPLTFNVTDQVISFGIRIPLQRY